MAQRSPLAGVLVGQPQERAVVATDENGQQVALKMVFVSMVGQPVIDAIADAVVARLDAREKKDET